jgi:uncharacterized membrane protein YgdD (TMEM256/DUF423 family)
MRLFGALGAVLGFLGVVFGAFGAHALRSRISPELLAAYNTGVQYHLIHALALLVVAWLATQMPQQPAVFWAGWFFVIGTMLFSGSLYGLAVSGVRILGAVTPFGGLAFLAGWVCLAVAFYRGGR